MANESSINGQTPRFVLWLRKRLSHLRPRWLLSGLCLCLLSVWWCNDAWAQSNNPQLVNALVAGLLPGLGLLYRGLRPVDPDLTLGYLLIWMFVAGLTRSLETPETLMTFHTLVGAGLFLLPGLIFCRFANREFIDTTDDDQAPPSWEGRYDGRYRGPYSEEAADSGPRAAHHKANHGSTHRDSHRQPPEPDANSLRPVYLRLLGLRGEVSSTQIRAAYRRKIARHHPDRVAHRGPHQVALAERRAAEINLAYDYLLRRRP